jgi:D-glycero-D-manno-heptose 1,7-bisphosphate phosphatase
MNIEKAIFLDRDGVINNNENRYYVIKPEDLVLNKGIIEALKTFQDHHFNLIIISNQSGISKKLYSKEDCDRVHDRLRKVLSREGISITEIYYCPHHPEVENCLCRKPGNLLFEKALARFNYDPDQSWMIGDSERDIMAAQKTAMRAILINSNEDLRKYIHSIIEKEEPISE